MKIKELEEEMRSCTKCELCKTRKNVVFGEGNKNAKIMFIAEAPGAKEDEQGRPFVGRAGKILDSLLNGFGIERKEVYIANILKCRPPKNRNPLESEIKLCTPFLEKQIELINPQFICTLGNFSTKFIMEKFGIDEVKEGITKVRGKIFKVINGKKEMKIFPMYHPALAAYNPKKIKTMKEDFKKLKNEIIFD